MKYNNCIRNQRQIVVIPLQIFDYQTTHII